MALMLLRHRVLLLMLMFLHRLLRMIQTFDVRWIMSLPFRWLMDRFWWTCSMRSMPCMRSWHSLDHLPFDDGVCLPFGILSQKGGVFVEFLFSRGEYFFGWSLWSLDCIQVLHIVFYFFSSCHVFLWDIHVRGSVVFFLLPYIVSCFKLFIDLYL